MEQKKRAYLFPGQGSQYIGMGKSFYQQFPLVQERFEEVSDFMHRDFAQLIFEGEASALEETVNCQLALYLVSSSIVAVVEREYALKAQFIAGLSLGECTALQVAHSLSFSQGISFIHTRALLMQEMCKRTPGKMIALLGAPTEKYHTLVERYKGEHQLWQTNYTYAGQTILAGHLDDVENCMKAIKEREEKVRLIPVKVEGAFHTPLMQEATEQFMQFLSQVELQMPHIPLLSNVQARTARNVQDLKLMIAQQISCPIQWYAILTRLQEEGVSETLIWGPGKSLQQMNQKIAPTLSHLVIDDFDDFLSQRTDWEKS